MKNFFKIAIPLLIPIVIVSIAFMLIFGSSKNKTLKPVPIRWGEDVCVRCDMSIVDGYHAAEIVNPQTKKTYKFDDIGCAILWLYKENKFKWADKAVIWVTSAKNGKWINAKKACWVGGQVTPMGFGFGAYESKPDNVQRCIKWKDLIKKVFKKEEKFEKALYG